ncbi:hypothetical protein K466DRAFT_592549, partial [Polyporus arcularius HHB13444]
MRGIQYQWAPLHPSSVTRPSIPRSSPMCTHALIISFVWDTYVALTLRSWTLEDPAGDASEASAVQTSGLQARLHRRRDGAAAAPTGFAILRSRTQDETRREETRRA